MASASLSAIAGNFLFTTLPQIDLDKLITYLCDYLSRNHPSSSEEEAKLHQLQKECEALEDANQKLKIMQSEAKNLLKKDTQNKRVINFLKKLIDFGDEIQDLESYMESMEVQRKVKEINQLDEVGTSQSSEKKRPLSSSEDNNNMVNRISSLVEQINNMYSDDSVLTSWNEIYYHQNKNQHETTSSINGRKMMASSSLSAIAGANLSPILPQIALDKLITNLWDYLSNDQSSSSGEASNKLQQLQNEWEALEDANQKLKTMQSEAKRLLKKDMQNVRVIHLLKKLNDVGYDIQDLESDLEYMELQRKVKERDQGQKHWFSFLWTKGQSSEKRRRLSQLDDNMVNQISSLIKQINSMDSDLHGLFSRISLNEIPDLSGKNHLIQNKCGTTSSTNEKKIYCREKETKQLVKLLLEEPYVNGNISVVPILGMGGIGKTTLARFAFNHPKIENYFDEKEWVSVSAHFDKFRITKEIAESLSEVLLTGIKKFLLVLDDVCSDEWQQLLASPEFTEVESIKIIVISRNPTVLAGLETRYRFLLGGLYGDEYRSFFIDCVFGNENPPDNYSLSLQSIGEQIMEKLKGSPLAVKTVGSLLGRKLTEEHWKHVLDSDLWKKGSDANDIMPALALSFHHLPEHLQLCFAFCSVFPKGHHINKHELIGMWIAHGYILESGTNSETLEDIGEEYLEELKQLSLIEYNFSCRMHDLLHDLAQSVSQGEVCIYEGKRGERISRNVHHLCVRGPVDSETVQISNSLRTLMLYGDDICNKIDLESLKRIRVLVVIDKNMQEFPEAVTHLKHLRYLDFSRSSIKWVPESLCRHYQLKVLRLPKLDALPSLFHSLINLRSFMFHYEYRSIYWDKGYLQGNLYEVQREGRYKIAQLRNMNELTGRLEIRGLVNIENWEEAKKGNLKEKGLIKYLTLCWPDHRYGWICDMQEVSEGLQRVQEEVLEGLQPHPNLKHLDIYGYMGSKSPSWLRTAPAALQMLTRIELVGCKNWSRLPSSIGLLPFLEYLELRRMENITIEGDGRKTEIFPSLKNLQLIYLTSVSFEGMSLSSSSTSSSSSSSTTQPGGRKLFPLLEVLTICACDVVNGLPWPMLSQLSELFIHESHGLDGQLPGCLKGLKSLTMLKIIGSECKTLFDRKVMATLERLNHVKIEFCNELISVDGLQVLPSLTRLFISHCPKLRRWWVEEEGTSEQQQQHGVKVLLPKLSYLHIMNCEDLESLPACLPLLPSLTRLFISHCPKLRRWWVEEGTSEQQQQQQGVLLPKLSELEIGECKNLESLPACLPLLPSLELLKITYCPKVRSFPEKGTSEQQQLPKLRKICIVGCEDLESLPAWLPLLPSLERLKISKCPKVGSFPEDGLPSSLRELVIKRCDLGLIERCQQQLLSNPDEWQMIPSYTTRFGKRSFKLKRKNEERWNEEANFFETDNEEADSSEEEDDEEADSSEADDEAADLSMMDYGCDGICETPI